jgi:hypothetical protein
MYVSLIHDLKKNMQETTAKKVPVKWPTSTLKKLSSNKKNFAKCRSTARVQTRALFHAYDLQDFHGSEVTYCSNQNHDLSQ